MKRADRGLYSFKKTVLIYRTEGLYEKVPWRTAVFSKHCLLSLSENAATLFTVFRAYDVFHTEGNLEISTLLPESSHSLKW